MLLIIALQGIILLNRLITRRSVVQIHPPPLSFQIAKNYFGVLYGGAIVGAICLLISFYALFRLEETFSKDLNYVE
ncbi:MAG: hypothetical protein C0415_06510 [Thermodesulfovibrio sp.]|nr:hypothetical protein [Thermodesulfovibrio sp.]